MISLYHNPACSKSRAALSLLRERGIEPVIIRYLEAPPSAEELMRLLALLGLRPHDLLRKGESLAKSMAADALDDASLISVLAANPSLIERPIIVNGDRAVIGRPPERVLEIL